MYSLRYYFIIIIIFEELSYHIYVCIYGVSQEKLATFEKMTVTGMNLRDLNVLLLHYPFMSNPRYCLGCATQKKLSTFLHFFTIAIFVSRT